MTRGDANHVEAFDRLVESVCDRTASAEQRTQMIEAMRTDAKLRDHYLKAIEMRVILRRELKVTGQSAPVILSEVDAAIPAEPADRPTQRSILTPIRCLAAAIALASAAVTLYVFAVSRPPSTVPSDATPIATLIDATGDVFVDDDFAYPGSDIPARTISIASGTADFLLTNRVGVKLEGNASLTMHSNMAATLTRGRAEFNCPPEARGFTVHTTDRMRIVDFGTRFLVTVDDAGRSRVTLIEGAVEVAGESDTAPLALAPYEGAELRGDRVVRIAGLVPGARAGFVTPAAPESVATRVSRPREPGRWFGESVKLVGPENGIEPYDARTMLRFIHATSRGASPAAGCEVYQAIDLQRFREIIDEGRLAFRFTARFNRVAGDAQTDTAFFIKAYVTAGTLERFVPGTHPDGTVAEGELDSDDDPTTWQPLTVSAAVPPGTRLLVLQLHASENIHNDATGVEFDGHYASGVELELVIEPNPASPDAPTPAVRTVRDASQGAPSDRSTPREESY